MARSVYMRDLDENRIAIDARAAVDAILDGTDVEELLSTRGRDARSVQRHNQAKLRAIEALEEKRKEPPSPFESEAEIAARQQAIYSQIVALRGEMIELDPEARRGEVLAWLPGAEEGAEALQGEPKQRLRDLREIVKFGRGSLSAQESIEYALLSRIGEQRNALVDAIRRARDELTVLVPPAFAARRDALLAARDAAVILQDEMIDGAIRVAAAEALEQINLQIEEIANALADGASWAELEGLAVPAPIPVE